MQVLLVYLAVLFSFFFLHGILSTFFSSNVEIARWLLVFTASAVNSQTSLVFE